MATVAVDGGAHAGFSRAADPRGFAVGRRGRPSARRARDALDDGARADGGWEAPRGVAREQVRGTDLSPRAARGRADAGRERVPAPGERVALAARDLEEGGAGDGVRGDREPGVRYV